MIPSLYRSFAVVSLALAGCSDPAPAAAPDASTADVAVLDAGPADSGPADSGGARDAARAACMPVETDYQPRSTNPSHATWPACRSDSNRFQPFTSNEINSAQRVHNFELLNANPDPIRDASGAVVAAAHPLPLFDATRDPAASEFAAAAAYYASAGVMTGLVERFSRRPDEHFPQPAGAVNNAATGEYDDRWCGAEANWMSARDYCVGPAALRPVMVAALTAGSMGGNGAPTRVHAARMEAALLYLFYASVYKESLSCLQDVEDCDSSWAYYSAGLGRDAAAQEGLARYVVAAEPETHHRIWDALLAVHCWRELDGGLLSMPPVATNRAMRERARDQLDRALNRGMVVIVTARLRALAAALGDADATRRLAAPAHRAFLGVVGPLFARALETWVPTKYPAAVAAAGATAVAGTIAALRAGDALDAAGATLAASTLDAVFDCP
jgi:hypothetical protein